MLAGPLMSHYLHVNTHAREKRIVTNPEDIGKKLRLSICWRWRRFVLFLDHEAFSVHHENPSPFPMFMILFTFACGQ